MGLNPGRGIEVWKKIQAAPSGDLEVNERFKNAEKKVSVRTCSAVVEQTPQELKLMRSWVQILSGAGLFYSSSFLSFPFSPQNKSVECTKSGPYWRCISTNWEVNKQTKIFLAVLLGAKQACTEWNLNKVSHCTISDYLMIMNVIE